MTIADAGLDIAATRRQNPRINRHALLAADARNGAIDGAAGFAFGGADMVFLIQMAMLFAGVATLFQTIGFGPVGARLPVMQGTSFAFVPIMISIVKSNWTKAWRDARVECFDDNEFRLMD